MMPQSKYCYPNTDVLINKFNIRDQEKLSSRETLVTGKRLLELQNKPVKGDFDLQHLKRIHKYIFQDIYPFAGKLRDENIAKDTFSFANALFLEECANDLFNGLKNEKCLSGLDVDNFSERAAYYMAEINVLHPFREGNGRTQREFIRTLSLSNGYFLDWSNVDKEKVFEASVLSKLDHTLLSQVINQCIVNREPSMEIKKMYSNDHSKESTIER